MSGRPEHGDQSRVLVVGAGPVGLTTALALCSRGVPVTVVEAEPEDRVRPGSRALFVHRESLSALDRMRPGLGAEISRFGVVWRTRRTLFRSREVFAETFPAPGPDSLPPFTSLRQVDTERFLMDACRSAGVEFRWGARISDVTVRADSATVVTDGGERWTAPYVIAADGAHSAVRKAIGVELRGPRSSGYHVVVDVADRSLPVERVFHYEHPGMAGRTVLRVPFTGGFQVDLQCRDDDPPEAYGTEAAARRWLPAVVETAARASSSVRCITCSRVWSTWDTAPETPSTTCPRARWSRERARSRSNW